MSCMFGIVKKKKKRFLAIEFLRWRVVIEKVFWSCYTCNLSSVIKLIKKKKKIKMLDKDGIITVICILKLFRIQNYTKVLLLFFNL